MGQTCSKACEGDNGKQEQRQPTIRDESVRIEYQNGNFNLPSKMPFQTQSTYAKIQKAAYNFCIQKKIDFDFMPCITRIIAYRQEKVFLAAFNKVPENKKQSFLEEVNRIPQDQIDLFYHNFVNQTQKKYSITEHRRKENQKIEFQIPKYVNGMNFTAEEQNKLHLKGKSIVQAGEVALVIMCAGASARFENEDKFLAPLKLKVNPKLTILDVIFMRLKARLKKSQIPVIITCNQVNFLAIQNFMRYMEVERLPVLDLNGKYCVSEKCQLIKRPFGTGRTVNQILKERTVTWLIGQGVKYIHFIGAENLMQDPCEQIMLGLIKEKVKKVCAKCVGSKSQWEKLPRYVASRQGKIYLKLGDELSDQISESALYSAYKYPIATNSIVMELEYLQELIKDFHTDIYLSENYHILRRREKVLNPSTNKVITTESLTFQGDIRDLLACCSDPLLYYAERDKHYAPIFSKKLEYPIEGTAEYYEDLLTDEYNENKSFQEYLNPNSNPQSIFRA